MSENLSAKLVLLEEGEEDLREQRGKGEVGGKNKKQEVQERPEDRNGRKA